MGHYKDGDLQMDYPKCSHCGREFAPGQTWHGSNFCRAAHLLPIIAANPGISTWELSQKAGMPYADTNRAVLKARDWNVLDFVAEERPQGGQRYRYTAKDGWQAVVDEWKARALI